MDRGPARRAHRTTQIGTAEAANAAITEGIGSNPAQKAEEKQVTDTKKAKDIGDVTDIPAGLDVVPSVPGTYIGGHDLQGADGEERTDRPGEILGTPIPDETRSASRAKEGARHDYVTSEVDRANREELPKLGGTVDSGWEPGDSKGSKAKTAATAPAATAPVAKGAPAAASHDSGISVSPKIDRG